MDADIYPRGHEGALRSGKAKGMSSSGKRWTVQNRYGNSIYLTNERWGHIIDDTNHPEMEAYKG